MTRGLILSVTHAEAAARARSLLGLRLPPPSGVGALRPILYKLGTGGTDPSKPHPGQWSSLSRRWFADCSALLCWAWGTDRRQDAFPGRWLNTDGLLREANTTAQWVQLIDGPELGCGLIYGGMHRDGKRIRVGHCAIVVAVPAEYDRALNARDVRVVHCSSSVAKRTGSAIGATTAVPFLAKGARWVRWLRAV